MHITINKDHQQMCEMLIKSIDILRKDGFSDERVVSNIYQVLLKVKNVEKEL
jgi:hypothetical protein